MKFKNVFSRSFSATPCVPSRVLFLLLVFSLALAGRSRWTGSAGVAPGLGAWNAAGVMNTARSTHTATRLNDGRVLVASGRSLAGQTTKSAEIYDPATDRWTPTGDLVEARLGHSALLLKDGRVLVVGFQSAEVFDPAMGKWALTGDMAVKAPSAASNDGASVTLLANGKVLVAGGGARLELVKRHASSRIEDGPAILNYQGPRIPVDQMHGGLAMKKAAKRAGR